MHYTGKFKPKHPEKYIGDVNNIWYRSLMELKFFNWLDAKPFVLNYSSEELAIPYLSPIDNKIHRYFPDMLIKMETQKGIKIFLVEIKPENQTKKPSQPKRKTKRFLKEVMTWSINQAKWKEAEEYCKARSWEFKLINENHLGMSY